LLYIISKSDNLLRFYYFNYINQFFLGNSSDSMSSQLFKEMHKAMEANTESIINIVKPIKIKADENSLKINIINQQQKHIMALLSEIKEAIKKNGESLNDERNQLNNNVIFSHHNSNKRAYKNDNSNDSINCVNVASDVATNKISCYDVTEKESIDSDNNNSISITSSSVYNSEFYTKQNRDDTPDLDISDYFRNRRVRGSKDRGKDEDLF
jgi:hypothetical protein